MAVKRLTCRTHGGIFVVPARQGRPPVRCGGTSKDGTQIPMCLRHPDYNGDGDLNDSEPAKVVKTRAAVLASKIKNNRQKARSAITKPSLPTLRTKGGTRDLRTTVQKPAEVVVRVNLSLPPAQKAKEALTAKGWDVKSISDVRLTDDGASFAEIRATRDEENLHMVWEDGKLITQDYQLWKNGHTPEANGRPKTKLEFDPEELSDQELIHWISGQPVKWWNRLGSTQEEGVIGNRVKIQHTYIGGTGDENPGERIVTFVDYKGGYRSFYVSALTKVG